MFGESLETMIVATRVLMGAAALALMVSACSPTTNVQGYVVDQRLVDAIRPGVDDHTSVKSMLGTPSITGNFDDKRWYYVSRTTEQLAFFKPEVLEQQVLVVNFDDKGYVQEVKKIGLADARAINPASGETPTRGRELGFWEQIFGNIGRFGGGGGAAAGGP